MGIPSHIFHATRQGNGRRKGFLRKWVREGIHAPAFVMEPFVEIAPDFVHPMLGRTARQILDSLGQAADDGD